MSGTQALTTFAPTEYEVIEATMSESARGRWFLAEFARRNRSADTEVLLDAMGRIESAVITQRQPDNIGHLRGDLVEMANAISRTKAEVAALSAPDQDQTRLGLASEALDAIVRATERATSDILGAAEEVQETAWTLRESGIEAGICDTLDRHATQIYTACSFQDITAQRTSRIVHTLRYLEERLTSMIAIWGDESERVPPAPGDKASRLQAAPPPEDLCQSDVDRYIAMEAPAVGVPHVPAGMAPFEIDDDIVFLSPAPEADAHDDALATVEAVEGEVADDADAIGFEFAADTSEPDRMAEPDISAEPDVSPASDFTTSHEPATADADDALDAIAAESDTGVDEAPEPVAAPAPNPAKAAKAKKALPPPVQALDFDDIDALSVEEKIALFA